MSPILYRLTSALRRQLAATAVLTVIVALMLGLVLTLVAGSVRTLTTPDRFTTAFGGGFQVALDQGGPLPSSAEIEALPAVQRVASTTFVFGFLVGPDQDQPVDAIVFTGRPEAVFGTRIVAGRRADPERSDELMVSSAFVAQTGAQIGDTFELFTLTQAQADASGFDNSSFDGAGTTAVVVGEFGGASDLQDGFAAALFSPALLELGDVGLGGGGSAIELAPGSTIAELRAQLDGLPNSSDITIGPAESVRPAVRKAVQTQGRGLAVLALFGGAAAVAVLGQLLGRQYRITDVERLALHSIGMTRRQLVEDPLARAAVPIVSGSAAAGVLAVAFSGLFPTGFVEQLEPHPGVRFDPLVHVVGSLALIALLLAWVAIALTAAGRPVSTRTATPFVERVATRLRPAQVATGTRFAFSGAGHRRWPAGSFAGVAVVLGVVVGALTFGSNVDRLIGEPNRWGSASLNIGSGGEAISDSVRAVLAADSDLAAVTYYANTTVSVGTEGLNITGIQPTRGDFLPVTLSGRLPQSDDEIVLGALSARALDVGIGDAFDATSETGITRLRVSGLAVIPGVERGDGIGEGGVVTAAGLQRIDPSAAFNNAGLQLVPDAANDTATRLAAATGMAIHLPQAPPEIVNLARVRTIPWLVAGVLAAFAVLSLTHQLVVSARNRRRDVGILKALGANRGFVSEVVHVQATVFTGVVTVLAVPIGVIAGQSIYRVIADGIGAGSDATVPLAALAGVVIGPLVLANLVAALPAQRARRLRPARYLNQE